MKNSKIYTVLGKIIEINIRKNKNGTDLIKVFIKTSTERFINKNTVCCKTYHTFFLILIYCFEFPINYWSLFIIVSIRNDFFQILFTITYKHVINTYKHVFINTYLIHLFYEHTFYKHLFYKHLFYKHVFSL